MNSIFKTSFILAITLFNTIAIADPEHKSWYLGVTGGASTNSNIVDDKSSKYGLLGGYQFKEWLSIEAEITKHSTKKKRFDDSYSDDFVDFSQKNQFVFVGVRATKYLGDVFGFTARVGAAHTEYKSNFEQESMLNISSAVGMVWRIKNFTITHEFQQVKYPIANNRSDNDLSLNLSLTYSF